MPTAFVALVSRTTAALGALAVASIGALGGCPSPAPQPRGDAEQGARTHPVAANPPHSTPSPPAERAPPTRPDPPAITTTAVMAPAEVLPPALRDPSVREVVQRLWQALETVDAGNPDGMAALVGETGRWLPPGGPDDGVTGATTLRRAMAPWTRDGLNLAMRRVIDLGGSPLFVQLSVGPDLGAPGPRYEMALVVELDDDGLREIRQYGDPLGPVRAWPQDVDGTLALGTPAAPTVEGGDPVVPHVVATRTLLAALDPQKSDRPPRDALPLARTVVMHDIVARRTHHGPTAYLGAFAKTLGPGRIHVEHHYAGRRFVVVEGSIHDRGLMREGIVLAHGFADIHRFEGGQIVETWHYENRRGRPEPTSAATNRP
ncbi:MAG: hypothetical protein K0V04_18755 [Deltaproteobacteria bacterium]|nr:hypothetical protein [Deltaproteobacteria bacterium]